MCSGDEAESRVICIPLSVGSQFPNEKEFLDLEQEDSAATIALMGIEGLPRTLPLQHPLFYAASSFSLLLLAVKQKSQPIRADVTHREFEELQMN